MRIVTGRFAESASETVKPLVHHFYGNMVSHMKTTFELPDDLFIAAKKRAAEEQTTLKELFQRGLRRELAGRDGRRKPRSGRPIPWVTAPGGLPPGLDVADRVRMHDWIRRQR